MTVLSLIVGIALFSFSISSANALVCSSGSEPSTISCFIPSGNPGNTVSLRDITDTSNVTKAVSLSLDKSSYLPRDSGKISVTDPYASLSASTQSSVIIKLNSTNDPVGINLRLNETNPSSSSFVSSFKFTSGQSSGNSLHAVIGDRIFAFYSPSPIFSPRMQVTFDNSGGDGHAILSDLQLIPDDEDNNQFSTVIKVANLTLTDGASVNPSGVIFHVTMSYANSQLHCINANDPACQTNNLSLWVSPPAAAPFHTFFPVSNPFTVTNDPIAKTISFDVDQADLDGSTSGSWLFVLCFDGPGIGGGGGGVIRPGLVLDFISGLFAVGGSSYVVSPPSFGAGAFSYNDGLSITFGENDTQTFDASKYNQEVPEQIMVKGMPVSMKLKTFEAYNNNGLVHMGLYMIPRGMDMITSNSIASIIWEKGKDAEVNDPNHLLSDSSVSSNTNDEFQYTQFSFTPTKSYDKMSFLVKAWNDHLYSTDVRFHDAITSPDQLVSLPDGVIKYDSFATMSAAIQRDGFSKPQILSHIHDTSSVFGSSPGKVYWVYDTRDHTVTLVLEDGSGKVVDMRLEKLKMSINPESQNYVLGNTIYSHHSLSRENDAELEETKTSETMKALDLLTQLYGRAYFEQYNLLGK